MAKFTYNIEGGIDFNSFMDRTNEETKMIDIGSLNVAGSPFLSYAAFNAKILDANISQDEMDSLVGTSLSYVLNNMITGLNPKFKYLIENKKFLISLKHLAEKNLIDIDSMISINKISYDYICSSKNEDIIISLLELSLMINIREAKSLETIGFDKSTISLALLAKNSEVDKSVSIVKFNNVLLANADEKVCTVNNLCDAYMALFNISDIFNAMMFDTKTSFKNDSMKAIYNNMSLAILSALEKCNPNEIYRILWGYSMANPYGSKDVRFSLHQSPLGPNTIEVIRILGTEGVFIR